MGALPSIGWGLVSGAVLVAAAADAGADVGGPGGLLISTGLPPWGADEGARVALLGASLAAEGVGGAPSVVACRQLPESSFGA